MKIEETTPNKRFVLTNEDIIMALNGNAYKLYSIIQFESNYKKECSKITKKLKFFSNRSGLSKKQILKCLFELELHGLIKIERTLGEQSIYHFAKELNYFNKKCQINQGNHLVTSEVPPSSLLDTTQLPEGTTQLPEMQSLIIRDTEFLTEEGNKKEYARAKAPAGFSFKPPSRFLEFWNAYPKKEGELICRRIWEKKGLDSITDAILEKLENQMKYDEKFKAGFIFSPRNYLQDERWRDEITRPIKQKEEEKEEEKEDVVEVNKKTLRQYVKVDNKLIRNPNYGVL
jgi:hypothetical protein